MTTTLRRHEPQSNDKRATDSSALAARRRRCNYNNNPQVILFLLLLTLLSLFVLMSSSTTITTIRDGGKKLLVVRAKTERLVDDNNITAATAEQRVVNRTNAAYHYDEPSSMTTMKDAVGDTRHAADGDKNVVERQRKSGDDGAAVVIIREGAVRHHNVPLPSSTSTSEAIFITSQTNQQHDNGIDNNDEIPPLHDTAEKFIANILIPLCVILQLISMYEVYSGNNHDVHYNVSIGRERVNNGDNNVNSTTIDEEAEGRDDEESLREEMAMNDCYNDERRDEE